VSAVRRHPIITFFVLTFVISWSFLPFEAIRFMPSGPLIVALIVVPSPRAGLRDLGSRIIRWRVRWYWYGASVSPGGRCGARKAATMMPVQGSSAISRRS
jgi:uncharacterized protein